MKFFTYQKQDFFGIEHNYTLMKGVNKSLLQISFGYYQFDHVGLPYLHLSIGHGTLLGFLLSFGNYSISFDLIGHNWSE
jgi:hypothetical protein